MRRSARLKRALFPRVGPDLPTALFAIRASAARRLQPSVRSAKAPVAMDGQSNAGIATTMIVKAMTPSHGRFPSVQDASPKDGARDDERQ